ncbi:MAG TPA: ATP-dependent zinc metalloprotease FtsH [Chloroflexota bacterium]|nr:ATP-dependent zinc metalloprotease FtsH [Chloroflexota bacterium]
MIGLLMVAVALLSWAVPTLMGGVVAGLAAWSESARAWLIGGAIAAVLVGTLVMLLRHPAEPRERPAPRDLHHGALPPPARVLGQSHVRSITTERPTTTFNDVVGVEEAREELQEVVEFLKCPAKFAAVGARIPKGVLLIGPPGCGKTLLARAVAGEAGVPFLATSGSEFVELYVGVGAARVRTLFQEARKQAPCIVFVDEIDAVGRRRGGHVGVSHEEREQTLNQILVEMDGFDQRTNVILLAATNRPDVLDPALLRPGRFDRQVMLSHPDTEGRRAILELHTRGKPLAPDVDLARLARQTSGLTGAELENLVNEAAILAARRSQLQIRHAEFEEALDRVVAGPRRKSRVLSTREKRITAYHEVGHALVAHCLPRADRVQKISIVSRGVMGGYTRLLPDEDRNLWSKSEFEAAMACAMGGHVAESLVFGEVTSGASNDLQKATEMARRMVCLYGMSEKLGAVAFASDGTLGYNSTFGEPSPTVSPEVARAIDEEVHDLLAQARSRAVAILTARRDALERTAQQLIEDETLEGPELLRLLGPTEWEQAA